MILEWIHLIRLVDMRVGQTHHRYSKCSLAVVVDSANLVKVVVFALNIDDIVK